MTKSKDSATWKLVPLTAAVIALGACGETRPQQCFDRIVTGLHGRGPAGTTEIMAPREISREEFTEHRLSLAREERRTSRVPLSPPDQVIINETDRYPRDVQFLMIEAVAGPPERRRRYQYSCARAPSSCECNIQPRLDP